MTRRGGRISSGRSAAAAHCAAPPETAATLSAATEDGNIVTPGGPGTQTTTSTVLPAITDEAPGELLINTVSNTIYVAVDDDGDGEPDRWEDIDNQELTYDDTDNQLSIEGGNEVDLSELDDVFLFTGGTPEPSDVNPEQEISSPSRQEAN